MIQSILNQLKNFGVHSLISQEVIILEILEDINQLNQIDESIDQLIAGIKETEFKKVMLVCPRGYLNQLEFVGKHMEMKGERVIYKRSLETPLESEPLDYEIWSPTEERSISFLSELMGRSLTDTKKFLKSMMVELPSQYQKMFTVFKINSEPIGVVLPHLEPGRNQEGRLFWIGVHPKHRGKGYGHHLHLIGLERLREDFKAKTYLGATEIDNVPMRKTMQANGCVEDHRVLTLEYRT
ncbi:GNAT family N-acetyltransferase [Piscibacillus sp. B03]|uniref:GNAT family N-acetyltransferase n=1 Tax=Piscibacillus sp. B03 TaxID=3457430 RepID=UPI003FCD2761